MEKQRIVIHIYDAQIEILIPKDQEQSYREACAMINDRLNAYFGHYKGVKDDKEICYYAMIDIALRLVNETKKNDVKPITDILSELSAEIAEVIK